MNDQRLRKYFKFTENDLSANQNGRFSAEQEKRLSSEAKAEQKSARSSAAILFVIALFGAAIGWGLSSIAPAGLGKILLLLMMGILWPFAWAWKGLNVLADARALREPVLRSVSGRIRLVHHSSEYHVLPLGSMEFDLEGNPSSVIVEGDDLTIYYLEATEEVLSVVYSKTT